MKRSIIIGASLSVVVVLVYLLNGYVFTKSTPEPTTQTKKYHQVRIGTDDFEILADMAVTQEEKSRGLSVKNLLAEDEGMMFFFQSESEYGFWMKDMKFPIDILWLDGLGRVVHIESNLQPCITEDDCPVYTPNENASYVLETVAGFAEKHKITVGTDLNFEIVS
jgi:uncharacterized membrane protein (UPF0127 family)